MSVTNALNKRIKEVKEFKKKINKRFKTITFLNDEYRKKQDAAHKKLMASAYETKKEKELGKKYEKATKESFKTDNPDQKFRLSKVDELNLDYDILFLYSKKDIGKTTQMAKKLEQIRAEDPDAQICFIRNSKEELKGFAEAMNNSPVGPCGTNGEYVGWKEDLKHVKRLTKISVRPCGFMAYASADGLGFVKGQGGDWDNLRFGIWDECNSVEGGLTHAVFQSIVVLLSSLNRDKRGSKRVVGYMMGNLLQKKNIFLDRLGVGSHTKLKVFDVHKDQDPRKEVLSRMLYLNTGDLFKGIEDQHGLATQFLTLEEEMNLMHNRPGFEEYKAQYQEIDLRHFKALFCFVFSKSAGTRGKGEEKKEFYICYIYKVPNSFRIIAGIEPYREHTIIKPGFRIITCFEGVVANKFSKVLRQEEEDFADLIEVLKEFVDIGEVGFGWQGSQEVFEEMGPIGETKFIEDDEKEK